MNSTHMPTRDQLPSSRQLVRSTLTALAVAIALLVAVVLPGEYGVDPVGVGGVLGLTKMGQIKASLRAEATPALQPEAIPAPAASPKAPDLAEPAPRLTSIAPPAVAPQTSVSEKTDTITFSLKPGEGAEIKLAMRANARVEYGWQAKGGSINYDTHGDPVNAPQGFYHGYGKGRAVAGDQGSLVAAFDGKHGWFWRNRAASTVVVTLGIKGAYSEVKRVR
jgi:hypothetical protein